MGSARLQNPLTPILSLNKLLTAMKNKKKIQELLYAWDTSKVSKCLEELNQYSGFTARKIGQLRVNPEFNGFDDYVIHNALNSEWNEANHLLPADYDLMYVFITNIGSEYIVHFNQAFELVNDGVVKFKPLGEMACVWVAKVAQLQNTKCILYAVKGLQALRRIELP